LSFPSVSNTVVQTFRCRGFDDGTDQTFLVNALEFSCGTLVHDLVRCSRSRPFVVACHSAD
jgi:hypothetical protein